MAGSARPAGPLHLYECYFACAGASGTRTVWAHNETEAIQVIREHPSIFGLSEHPIVGHPTRLHVREAQALA